MSSKKNRPKKGYNGYLIPDQERSKILSQFPPKYSKVIAHHITNDFGVYESLPPEIESCFIVGHADSGDGIEALVVEVNGTVIRNDGELFHITLSLDPEKYKSKDSNNLIKEKGFEPLTSPVSIVVEPKFFLY